MASPRRRRNEWVEHARRRTRPMVLAGGLLVALGLATGAPAPWMPWCAGAATTILMAMGALATAARPRGLHVLGALAWLGAIYALQLGSMASLIHAGALKSPLADSFDRHVLGMAALACAGALFGWLGMARSVLAVRHWRTLQADDAENEPSDGVADGTPARRSSG